MGEKFSAYSKGLEAPTLRANLQVPLGWDARFFAIVTEKFLDHSSWFAVLEIHVMWMNQLNHAV